MTTVELQAYARDGCLPQWFTGAVCAAATTSPEEKPLRFRHSDYISSCTEIFVRQIALGQRQFALLQAIMLEVRKNLRARTGWPSGRNSVAMTPNPFHITSARPGASKALLSASLSDVIDR